MMSSPSNPGGVPPDSGAPGVPLLAAVRAWQQGDLTRDALVQRLTARDPDLGAQISPLLRELGRHAAPPLGPGDTEHWRAELLACRARAWPHPDSAGLLVGPQVLILTDGEQGAVLSARQVRPLSRSVSASLLLLCQTIVMADHAVDARELGALREQRIESTSTSLSEIEPIE